MEMTTPLEGRVQRRGGNIRKLSPLILVLEEVFTTLIPHHRYTGEEQRHRQAEGLIQSHSLLSGSHGTGEEAS